MDSCTHRFQRSETETCQMCNLDCKKVVVPTELVRLTNSRITIEVNDNNTIFKPIMKSNIEKIVLSSLPDAYTAFEVEIGGVVVFRVERDDFDKYLEQIKVHLSLLSYHKVRFHFLCDVDKLGVPLKYESKKKVRYVPNPAFVPKINEITGECMNIEDAHAVEYIETDEKTLAPVFLQSPPFELYVSNATIPPFGKFEHVHIMVDTFLPRNIGPCMKKHMNITPLEKGLTLDRAISRGTPFKAEYTNYLRYNGGLGGLLYSVG